MVLYMHQYSNQINVMQVIGLKPMMCTLRQEPVSLQAYFDRTTNFYLPPKIHSRNSFSVSFPPFFCFRTVAWPGCQLPHRHRSSYVDLAPPVSTYRKKGYAMPSEIFSYRLPLFRENLRLFAGILLLLPLSSDWLLRPDSIYQSQVPARAYSGSSWNWARRQCES